MRISTAQFFSRGLDAIQDNQARVVRTQTQLGSGQRILEPSDDPAGTAQLLGLNESIASTNKFQASAERAQARLSLEEDTLAGVIDSLQRARELAVQGLNATNSAGDRQALARDVRQILDQVQGLANTEDGNGEYLFAGNLTQSTTLPFTDDGAGTYTYNGDQGQRMLQISSTRQIATSDSGLDVFMKISDPAGGGFKSVFASLEDLAVGLETNTPAAASLDELDAGIGHILDTRATIGARLNAIDSQVEVNESSLLQLEQTRSKIQDLDYNEAITRFNQEMVALEAAQQTFVRVQDLSLFNFLR